MLNRQHDVEKHDRRPAAVQRPWRRRPASGQTDRWRHRRPAQGRGAPAYRGRPVLRAHRLRQPGGEAEQQNGERRES